MTNRLPGAALAWLLLCCTLLHGQATYYAPGVFDEVWGNRRAQLQECAECVGYAAMADCAQLGRRIWVYGRDAGEWIGPLHVIDCAVGADRAEFERRGHVVELPFWLARRWDMRGPIPVIVAMGAEGE